MWVANLSEKWSEANPSHSHSTHLVQKQLNRERSLRSQLHRVSEKNCANFVLPERLQISTNFDNFWQQDGKEAKIMQGALNFHLT